MVVVKVRPLQPMQAAIAGVGVVDVLAGDTGLFRAADVNEIQDLLIQSLALLTGQVHFLLCVLHSFHSLPFRLTLSADKAEIFGGKLRRMGL